MDPIRPTPRVAALLAAGALLAAPATHSADVYRWVDESGRVHYGDRRPVERAAEEIEIHPGGRPDPGHAARRERRERLLDAFAIERERRETAQAEERAEKREREERCREMTRRLAEHERAGLWYRTGEGGERDYVSDAERARALERMRAHKAEACE